MSIIRSARKERDFAVISNHVLQDASLSMRALGLLVRLLSRPDNWETNSEVLAREFNCGREQMRSVLTELRDAGYMKLVKTQDEKGHWSSRWMVLEEPETGKPEPRLPEPGNRVLGDPDAITKTDNKEPIQRTDKKRAAKPRSPSSLKNLQTFIDECKAAGVKPIPDDHYIRTYAADAGIRADMMGLCWIRFVEDHTEGTRKTKKYKDWGQAFANCVKDNWYGFWYVADGVVQMTSKCELFKAAFDAKRAREN